MGTGEGAPEMGRGMRELVGSVKWVGVAVGATCRDGRCTAGDHQVETWGLTGRDRQWC